MIPSDIRLYTWTDAEELLARTQKEHEWPDWLISVQAYWDGITVDVRPQATTDAIQWLASAFEPRWQNDPPQIELESLPGIRRFMPVHIQESDTSAAPRPFRPTLARPSIILASTGDWEHPEPLDRQLPPVIAFHSFKGGVGRTVHALAFSAFSLPENGRPAVLIVDADLEAPGLTWLFRERFPEPAISFVDFLALVHGDPDPDYSESLQLAADRLRGTQVDNLFVMPSFRQSYQFSSLEVRPEHLVRAAQDPFILTSMLARLGSLLSVDAVVVDLRAGLSEISAGLLLDPRVYRVFVTTTSSQSVQGSCHLLELIGEIAPSRQDYEPLPALVITQVPEGAIGEEFAVQAEAKIVEAGQVFLEPAEDSSLELTRVRTYFEPNLLSLPDSWKEVLGAIKTSRIARDLSPLAFWVPSKADPVSPPLRRAESAKGQREKLSEFASRLIFAETGSIEDFLATSPLKNLASDYRAKVPVVVVVGSKGAGKTYTFLQAVQRGTWQEFVKATGIASPSIEAFLCPTLTSLNVQDNAKRRVDKTLRATARALGSQSPPEPSLIRDYLRDGYKESLHEGQWRDRWLNVIAWSMGFRKGDQTAGRQIADYLRSRKRWAVALVDGLEDLFQEFWSSPEQQIALRALLQDVPDWFSQQPDQPLGLVIFVRRDMVLSAVKQNPLQLMARYEPYALRWDSDEALRLVAWICSKAGVLDVPKPESIEQASRRHLIDLLASLWGRKLGSAGSREALSADWVIAALSDLNGQIQARDVVRFLHEAAQGSINDTFWKERLLVPTAIRAAVAKCSEKKIEEIGLENPKLGQIFSALQNLPEPTKQIPFTPEQIGLSLEELRILEDNGAVLREAQEYYMPEIFRSGLGFKLKRGARPRVMSMARARRVRR